MIAATNIKINGKWYRPGEEIPETKVEVARDYVKSPYTKNAIMRMSTKDLRKVGAKYGLKHTDDMTGSEVKAWLINKFGL